MLDLHARDPRVFADEADLYFGGIASVGVDVPLVDQAVGRFPRGDPAPVHLLAGGSALKDPPTRAPLPHHLHVALLADRVRDRPPQRRALGPHAESMLRRTAHL